MPARTISLDELSDRFGQLVSVGDRSVGIGIADASVAAYARVLEYGSIAGQRPWAHPGERTVAAVNPETGAQVVVSAQAPQGFIRVRVPEFLNQLREQIANQSDWLNAGELDRNLGLAIQSVAAQAQEDLRAVLPRDSGRLAQSLTIVNR